MVSKVNNKGLAFVQFFDGLVEQVHCELPDDVAEYYSMIKSSLESDNSKPTFTETGLAILEYLQKCEAKNLKARDIADGLVVSSRKVSGAMRKLVSDGWCEKFGSNPTIYSITNQGKEFDISKYKEIMNYAQGT